MSCSGGGDTKSETGPDAGQICQSQCSDAGTTEPGAPIILSFSTNVTSLSEDETVTFTAVVTDPDGIDDLIGGTLSSTTSGTFGSFVTAAQEGAYALTISWDQINQVQSIDLENETPRSFVATFYDVAGHERSQTLELQLTCGESTGLACDGQCQHVTGVGPDSGSCNSYCNSFGNGLFCGWANLIDSSTCTEDTTNSFSCSTAWSSIPDGQYYECVCQQ